VNVCALGHKRHGKMKHRRGAVGQCFFGQPDDWA
jgi:hypothetical protein